MPLNDLTQNSFKKYKLLSLYDLTRKVIYLSPYFDFITRNKIIKLLFLFETHPLTVFPSNNKKSQDFSLLEIILFSEFKPICYIPLVYILFYIVNYLKCRHE